MKRLFLSLYMLIAAVALPWSLYAAETADSLYVNFRTLLWNPGDHGSKFYRIPAVVTAPDGTLVAVADKRIDNNADLPGRIDVVCRTSGDNGKTWTDPVTVKAHDEDGGYGDPALVVDRNSGDVICLMTHGNGLWQSTPDNHATVMLSRSSDNGKTWSEPVDIVEGTVFSSDKNSNADIKAVTLFATSGRALQLKDGRLMYAAVVKDVIGDKMTLGCHAVYSDDGGLTWRGVSKPVDPSGDESKIVELPDGRLLMSIRNRGKGYRRFATSDDRGASWSRPVLSSTLSDPSCNGDIINYTAPDGRELLLHSIPDNPSNRVNVSIYASDDNGATWHRITSVCPSGSAYSSINIAPDGSLGCFTEEDSPVAGYCLWYTSLDIDRLIKDRFGVKSDK